MEKLQQDTPANVVIEYLNEEQLREREREGGMALSREKR
jgi:hypothetical protein